MKKLIFLLFPVILAFSCKEDDLSTNMPACIQDQWEAWDFSIDIYSYTYRDQTVYYFPPQCCDIPSVLFDRNCNIICNPDGGWTGGGDGRCPDFFEERTDEQLIPAKNDP